jgi:hypothetical protein
MITYDRFLATRLLFPLILLAKIRRHNGNGNVQRGILVRRLNSYASKEYMVKQTEGYIKCQNLCPKAGLKKGGCYYKLDNQNIATYADLSVYKYERPNDKVENDLKRWKQ